MPTSASSCEDYFEINEPIEESPAADVVSEDGSDFVPIGDGYDADREDADNNETLFDNDQTQNPLAGLLPPEYKNVDPREFFPDFRKGKVENFYFISE